MSEETERRKQAWETRRKKYGRTGHSRGAYGHSGDHVASMQALLIRLHAEGTLSEGQVSKATGLHRITVRKMADDYTNGFSTGWGSHSAALSSVMSKTIPKPIIAASDEFLGSIAYALTKRLVIDMPTARAAVDDAIIFSKAIAAVETAS